MNVVRGIRIMLTKMTRLSFEYRDLSNLRALLFDSLKCYRASFVPKIQSGSDSYNCLDLWILSDLFTFGTMMKVCQGFLQVVKGDN